MSIATTTRAAALPLGKTAAWRHGYYLVGTLFAFAVFVIGAPRAGTFGIDTYSYWSVSPPVYDGTLGQVGNFPYSPAFYQVVAPFHVLDWPVFLWLWTALDVATAIWLGPLALAFPFTSVEIYHGNVHLLLAAAIVLGFRYPWTWAFVLLTKVTPGVGLLWFAVRREWYKLAVALVATVAVVAVSFAADSSLWFEWVEYLTRQSAITFGLPLWMRLPLAALVVVWGARTDRPWTVAVAATLALPNLWWHGLAVLAAVPLLLGLRRPERDRQRRVLDGDGDRARLGALPHP